MPEITFFKGEAGFHEDSRRRIFDGVLPANTSLPFQVRQIKIVDVVSAGMVVGNHYHNAASGRWECFIVTKPFTMRFRVTPSGEVQERTLLAGDGCIIPPLNSHSFLAAEPGQLIGLSNLPYDSSHDIVDKLF